MRQRSRFQDGAASSPRRFRRSTHRRSRCSCAVDCVMAGRLPLEADRDVQACQRRVAYRHTLIRDVDASTFQPLDKQDAKDAACAYHARSRRRQWLITAVSPAHGRICHWPSIPFTSNIRLGKSMLKVIARQKPWSFGSAS